MLLSSLSKKVRWLCGGLLICAGYLPSTLNVFYTSSSFAYEKLSYGDISANFSDLLLKNTFAYEENPIFNFSFEHNNKLYADFSKVSLKSLSTITNQYVNQSITDAVDAVIVEGKLNNSCKGISKIKVVDIGAFPDSKMIKGEIRTNFYADARKEGIPASVVDSVIKTLSEKIDFRRSLKTGDVFEILYSKKNEMLYAKIKTKRKEVAVYRVTSGKNNTYCFANGELLNKVLSSGDTFGQPLRGRLVVSDRFGMRRHPITGILHHHNGVDLRANYGEPVYAIYDGIISRASPYYGYGNCVDIKHPQNYSSRYAHLSRIAVRFGQYVKKGQLLGYAGATGRVTGTHLHLELAKNNKVMNPMNVKMLQAEKKVVSNIDMKQFNSFKNAVNRIFLSE